MPWSAKRSVSPSARAVAVSVEGGVRVELPGEVERGEPGRGGDRVPGQRPGLVHGPDGRELLHHVAPAAERGAREPAADDLAEDRQVGRDAVHALRAAERDPEPGDHLVEHQQRPRLRTPVAEALEEPRLGRHDAHVGGDGLDDRRGDPVAHARRTPGRPRARSLNGTVSVSRAAPSVTPGDPGRPSVATPLPAPFASSASEWPW